MYPIFGRVFLAMCICLMLTGVSLGKQVYLKDGATIECESFGRKGKQVVVKVNRDILLEFEQGEINLKRTFGEAKRKVPQVKRKKLAGKVSNQVIPSATAGAITPVAAKVPSPPPAEHKPQTPVVAVAPETKQSTPSPAAKEAVKPEAVEAAAPATKEVASSATVGTTATENSTPPDKAELERRSREAAEMMAEALKKQDPELMKKAIEAQKSVMAAQKGAMPTGNQRVSQAQMVQQRAFATKILLIVLVLVLLMIVSTWVVFGKAGQPGWHSIIPIYNMYVMMEISGKPWWWMLLLFVPIVGFIIYLLAMLSLAQRFGRGFIYGLGLFFLPMFFFPMLAFGGARYEG